MIEKKKSIMHNEDIQLLCITQKVFIFNTIKLVKIFNDMKQNFL